MTKQDFVKSLPKNRMCYRCKGDFAINPKAWLIVPFESSEFIGICAIECSCGCREVAAVGSSMIAHRAAQALRLQTLKDSGIDID